MAGTDKQQMAAARMLALSNMSIDKKIELGVSSQIDISMQVHERVQRALGNPVDKEALEREKKWVTDTSTRQKLEEYRMLEKEPARKADLKLLDDYYTKKAEEALELRDEPAKKTEIINKTVNSEMQRFNPNFQGNRVVAPPPPPLPPKAPNPAINPMAPAPKGAGR